jgi:glycosyltransferase involved in cell wall biosynthesis
MRWGPHIPTGIARVDASLLASVLKDYAGQIELFAFDHGLRRCRRLTADESAFLEQSVDGSNLFSETRGRSMSLLRRVSHAARVYRKNPFLTSTESHRSVAQFISRSAERRGLGYLAAKIAVRASFFLNRLYAALRLRGTLSRSPDPLSLAGADCLVSINTCRSLQRFYTAETIRARVHLLVYDTIPLDHPEFVSRRHAKHFEDGLKFGLEQAASCLCISQATVESCVDWAERLGSQLSSKPVHALHLASSLADLATESAELDELRGRPFVVYCSTIDARKNHDLLLDVWEDLARDWGAERVPLLVLVGKAAMKRNFVEKRLKESATLRSVVRVFSRLEDEGLIWLYKNAAFSVFPSKAEGWGLGATESLDFGTPVVISDIPALREATQDLMPAVDPCAAAEWRRTIERLIVDGSAVDRLRRRIAAEYRRRPGSGLLRQVLEIVRPDMVKVRAEKKKERPAVARFA